MEPEPEPEIELINKRKERYFYGQNRKDGEFSNFYQCDPPFEDEQCIQFNSSEQKFMYEKVKFFEPNNSNLIRLILKETNPGKIKAYGGKRHLKTFDDKAWDKVKAHYMETALLLKFHQNEHLKKHLLSTGNDILYEASPSDKIWGIGFGIKQALTIPKEQYGQNLLGKTLMKVRDEIRKDEFQLKETEFKSKETDLKPRLIFELLNKDIIDNNMYLQLTKVSSLDKDNIDIIIQELLLYSKNKYIF